MIHRVSANKKSFHEVTFSTGLNVILAEQDEISTKKDTRNGVGKTTLLKIIDFCLGSRAVKGKGLLIEPLAGWAFTLEITLSRNRVKVTRAIDKPNRIIIDGKTDGWVDQPDNDKESGKRVFNADKWRGLLGWALFNLPSLKQQLQYKPSYRSLISYLIRLDSSAYSEPFQHFSKQKRWDIQLHTAYLLGMNWEYASHLQSLKDREGRARTLEKAIKAGELEGIFGTVGELETKCIQLEQQTKEAKQALSTFKVHPQYESIQQDVDRLTGEIHDISNRNVVDRRLLTHYQKSIKEEKPPSTMSLENLYEEAGCVFSDSTKRSLEEARTFHHQIISNRRDFLELEIERLQRGIKEQEARIKKLTDERAEIMQILQTHGALQELTKLQERHVMLQELLNRAHAILKNTKDLQTTKRKINTDKTELVQTAERDHEQRRDLWSTAVRLFNENSQALYKSSGKLVIDLDETGYKYRVHIERSGSEGIDKMKIFCFDLAILQLQMQTGKGINFIVHDTLMYDTVDTRQRAQALEHAHEVTSTLGGQYICTLNSDMVPTEYFSEEFDFERHVRLKLSDADASESLLGIRFEKPEN